MKLNYSLLAAALLMFGVTLKAQDVSIGVKGGLNIPKITVGGTKTPLSEGYASRLAWGAGAFTEIKFTKMFSLIAGLEYSGQGGQKDGVQAIPSDQIIGPMISGMGTGLTTGLTQLATGLAASGNVVGAGQIGQFGQKLQTDASNFAASAPKYLYGDFKSVAKFNYLMLPVQGRFGWNLSATSPFRVYVNAGLFGSYLMSAERVSSGSSAVYLQKDKTAELGSTIGQQVLIKNVNEIVTDPAAKAALNGMLTPAIAQLSQERDFTGTQDITDDLHRFNFGFIGAAGISYKMGRSSIFIEAGGNYGFLKLQKSTVNGQNRIGAGTVMAGYSYSL